MSETALMHPVREMQPIGDWTQLHAMRLPCAALTTVAHILASGTPFMACRSTIPMSKTYPAETATTAGALARLGRPSIWPISQPAIGKICNAWIPKKCATLKSPLVVLQLTTGSPGPPGATPTTLCPCATITPPMTDPTRKRRIPNTIPSWDDRETLYLDCKAKISRTRTKRLLRGSTMSISEETAESKGVLLLKCEVVPRAACMAMQVMAVKVQIETPQLMIFFHHIDARR